MRPVTLEQQKRIATLIQSIHTKAQQFNAPIADITGFSIGYIPAYIIASLCKITPPFSWIYDKIFHLPIDAILRYFMSLDMARVTEEDEATLLTQARIYIQNLARKKGIDVDLNNLANVRKLAPQLVQRFEAELKKFVNPAIEQAKAERLSRLASFDTDGLIDKLTMVAAIVLIAFTLNRYAIRPMFNRWFPTGFPRRQATTNIDVITEQEATTLIEQLEKIEETLIRNLRNEKYLARTALIVATANHLSTHWNLIENGIISNELIFIANFFNLITDPVAIVGRAAIMPSLLNLGKDVVELTKNLISDQERLLQQRIDLVAQQFTQLVTQLNEEGYFHVTVFKGSSLKDSFIEIALNKRYANAEKRSNAVEYLLFLFGNHNLNPQKIGKDTIRIPATELAETKIRKIAHQFRCFEERQEENQQKITQFKKAIQQIIKEIGYYSSYGPEINYVRDTLNLLSIKGISITLQITTKSNPEYLQELLAECFAGVDFTFKSTTGLLMLEVVDCPKPDLNKLNTLIGRKKSSDQTTPTQASTQENTWTTVSSNLYKRLPPSKGKGRALPVAESQPMPLPPTTSKEIHWPRSYRNLPGTKYDNLEHSELLGSNWSAFFTEPKEHFNTEVEYNAFRESARGFARARHNAQGIVTLDNPILMHGIWYTHEVKRLGDNGQIRVLGHQEKVETDIGMRNTIVFDSVDLTAHS
jgi:hypothetical protein